MQIQTKPIPSCPKCGAQMVLKRPSKVQHWPAFWGCSLYRYGCGGKRNIAPDGTPENDTFKPWDFD